MALARHFNHCSSFLTQASLQLPQHVHVALQENNLHNISCCFRAPTAHKKKLACDFAVYSTPRMSLVCLHAPLLMIDTFMRWAEQIDANSFLVLHSNASVISSIHKCTTVLLNAL